MTDFDLLGNTFDRILKLHGEDFEPSLIPTAHRTVIFVYHTLGIIGNGGFQYLFEGNLPGDSEYLFARQAYKTIGATDASAAFEKAFAVFPKATPPADIDERLEMWLSKYDKMSSGKDDSSPDSMYFSAMKNVEEKLADYIRANAAEFAALPE